ncbi:hypothetical protein MKW92_030620 [Papaver armeniacum]|nr:hypothetical protein MKW92_030620 [Papaver armeniacum]
MQGIAGAIRLCNEILKHGLLRRPCVTSSTASWQHKGLENTTVADVLKGKEKKKMDMYLMTRNNIGSLVVLRPGEQNSIDGIITERDYLKKIIVQGRHSKQTKVGEIMTQENKLITVNSDTNIVEAMQLMTENHIRHVPVIDAKIVGLISIVDVVRAVVAQQDEEVKRLNDFIKGGY